jgi:hypothetical protein
MSSINRLRLARSASSDMAVTSTRGLCSGRFFEREREDELDDVYDELDDPREREGERRRRDMSSRERSSIEIRRATRDATNSAVGHRLGRVTVTLQLSRSRETRGRAARRRTRARVMRSL